MNLSLPVDVPKNWLRYWNYDVAYKIQIIYIQIRQTVLENDAKSIPLEISRLMIFVEKIIDWVLTCQSMGLESIMKITMFIRLSEGINIKNFD